MEQNITSQGASGTSQETGKAQIPPQKKPEFRTGVIRSDIQFIPPGEHGDYAMIFDPLSEAYYKLSERSCRILQLMDRSYEFSEFLARVNSFGLDCDKAELLELINFLHANNLVAPEYGALNMKVMRHREMKEKTTFHRFMGMYLFFRLPPIHPDGFFTATMPFIRMVAGPLDYTQGAMNNATRENFRSVYTEPMSQGTRCRQLAEYVIFDSPLNMLCDAPTNYLKEEECTRFIASIPTVWDETKALSGKVGEYIVMARQKDAAWYVGGLTNWDARTVDLDLSFIGSGDYQAELFEDGLNADKVGKDYRRQTFRIPINRKLKVLMAPGGGFVIKITKL